MRFVLLRLKAVCGDITFGLSITCLVWVGVGWLFVAKGESWCNSTTIPALAFATYLITPAAPYILGVGLVGLASFILLGLLEAKERVSSPRQTTS